MIEISNRHYRFLKRIKKQKIVYVSNLSPDEKAMAQYLAKTKCIKAKHQIDQSTPEITRIIPKSYEITQYGEAQIYVFKAKFYKWWIPVVIYVFALIVSIAALFWPFDI